MDPSIESTPTPAEMTTPTRSRLVVVLILSSLFALAHTQAPLYFSNQHQYFLHGLAHAGEGDLRSDWLAHTADPTPAFSALVTLTAKYLHPYLFHVYYFVLLAIYAICLKRIVEGCGILLGGNRGLIFLALLSVTHAGIVRWLSVRLAGVDYPWYLQAGVAGQYLLGPGLQSSAFGVLMLASIAAYLHDRPRTAVLLAAAAALVHFTYFLTAGMLTVAYSMPAYREGRVRYGTSLIALGFLAMSPGLLYSAWTFAPTSLETSALAQRVLVHFRIPHHAVPQRWFDTIAGLQLFWIALGIAMTWRTRLFSILVTVSGLSLLLSIVHLVWPMDLLALLFPWRASALLMPIATALILARSVQVLRPVLESNMWSRRVAAAISLVLLLAVVAGGIWVMVNRQAYHANVAERPLLDHIRDHRRPGDVYLLPVRPPKPKPGDRGVISTSFTPPPRSHKDQHLIAVDLQRFRLYTGAAIFVDFKSIPYKDIEVLEWRTRLALVERWYAENNWDDPGIRAEMERYGITHVVAATPYVPNGAHLSLEYADDAYRLYRLTKP